MEFNYSNGVKTVEEAVFTAMLATVQGCGPQIVDPSYIRSQAEDLLEEVRSILTGELTVLFDKEGVAEEWNSAVEMAIRFVEESAT